jgi:peptidoglycan/LPS O-acetylase OafA/YrhL
MGIAILWIVWFNTLSFNPFLIGNLLTFLKSIGYFGVDIFLFLSGFGLITGWVNKQYTITAFYKRRLLRIMPAYWVVLSGVLLGKILLGQEYRVSIADFFVL